MEHQININGLQSGHNSLTIYEGQALDLQHPVQLLLSGNIESITNFLKVRYANGTTGKKLQLVDRDTAVVIADEQAMKIVLKLDPNDVFGSEVTASLEYTPELLQFGINSTTTFTRESLIKLLKFNRALFESPDKHAQILQAYQSLKIKTDTELQQENDNRGNKAMSFAKRVDSTGIPTEFILQVPIFKGQKTERFRVEICLDATDATVRFWFESIELKELIDTRKKEIFATQLAACADFVTIHK